LIGQPERCVLVLDNARILDSKAVASLRSAGVIVLLMPRYSPDFKPNEDVFSVGNCWPRRWSSPDQFNMRPMTAIDAMLLHIIGDMRRGFFKAAI